MLKKILIGLLLSTSILSSGAFAASGSANVSNIVGFGGFSQMNTATTSIESETNLTLPTNSSVGQLVTLVATVNAGTDHQYYRLHRIEDASGSGSAFQVPSGQVYQVLKVYGANPGSAVTQRFQLCTATASFTDSDVTAPTGVKWQSGYTSRYVYFLPTPSSAATLAVGSWQDGFTVDESLFPCMQSLGGDGLAVKLMGVLRAKN